MTNYYYNPSPKSTPTTRVNREDYVKLIFATLCAYRAGSIGSQICRTELCHLIRRYTDHKTWRNEHEGPTKFIVRWTTQNAHIARSNGQAVEVDHAIPVEFIADGLMQIETLIEMLVYLEDNVRLVYVTKNEHRKLADKLPADYMESYKDRQYPFMARYYDAGIAFIECPDLEPIPKSIPGSTLNAKS